MVSDASVCVVRSAKYLGEVNAERVHIQTVEEAGKALAEPGQAFVHQLKVHHVGFEIGHRVRKFGKSWLESIQWERRVSMCALPSRIAEG